MAQTFLVFDFGGNEESAQQARLILERWKQSFRLDKKLLLKFDRQDAAEEGDQKADKSAEKKEKEESGGGGVIMIVRLDFSDHEKLSHHRWIDRIPAEPLFKDANPKVVRHGDEEYGSTARRFEELG